MAAVFNCILQMSITASYVIIVVLVLRILLRKAPKKYSYYLWSAVMFRLCCPFSFSSVLSIFNLTLRKGNSIVIDLSDVPVSSGVDSDPKDSSISFGIPQLSENIRNTFGTGVSAVTPQTQIPEPSDVQPGMIFGIDVNEVVRMIWLAGTVVLLMYAAVTFIRMYRKLKFSVRVSDRIRQAEIRSPFLFGLIHPVIYIPFGLDPQTEELAIAHESYHMKRKDHYIRTIAFLLLCIHWFNPFCWIAYFLMIRDMEMSCDEHVLTGRVGAEVQYSNALLSFATGKRFAVAGPISFGESNIKERIINVLRFRNAGKMTTAAAALICILTLISCASNGNVAAQTAVLQPGFLRTEQNPNYVSGELQEALSGYGPWCVTASGGIYYLAVNDGDSGSARIVYIDSTTNQKSLLCIDPECSHDSESCSAYVKGDSIGNLLLTDGNKDCLLLLQYDTGSLIRMNLDGTEKKEIIKLDPFVLDYFDKNTIQTIGSRLYIDMRPSMDEHDVRYIYEIDVDACTQKEVLTLGPDQFISGGFGTKLIIETVKKSIGSDYADWFTPSRLSSYSLYDIDTGELTEVFDAALPYTTVYCGNDLMWMTSEGEKLLVHVFDLASCEERIKELTVDPGSAGAEKYLYADKPALVQAVDDTHFMLEYCYYDLEKDKDGNVSIVPNTDGTNGSEGAFYCIVDAESGVVTAFCPSAEQFDGVSVYNIFAQTENSFYLSPAVDPYTALMVVPRSELLGKE